MSKIRIFLISLYRSTALRIWLVETLVYSMFSVCPFCGKNACPGNFGTAALVGAVFAFGRAVLSKGKRFLHICFLKKRRRRFYE